MSEHKHKKHGSDSKKKYIILGLVGALIVILAICFFLIMRSPTTPAYLNIEQGEVEVNQGSGWSSAQDGMELSLDDQVRTLESGSAILVLYESIIVNLKENTEVKISELAEDKVKIDQNSGTTWNKFTKLAGIASYEIETPNTVATVRGTDFEITMDSCMVETGLVDYKAGDQRMELSKMTKGRLVDGKLVKEEITEEDKARMVESKKKMMTALRKIRTREVNKHPNVYRLAKKMVGVDDAGAAIKVQKMDWGRIREDQLNEKAPFRIPSVEKFVDITKLVKIEKKQLEELGYYEPKPSWMTGAVKDDGAHGDLPVNP